MGADDHDQNRRFERYYELIAAVYDAAQGAILHRMTHGGFRVVVTPSAFRTSMRQLFGYCRGEPRSASREKLDGRDVEEWEGHAELRAAMLCNTVGEA